MKTQRMILVVVLTAVLAGSGCIWRGSEPWSEDAGIFPGSPDVLMENFVAAYGAQDLEAYAPLLHEDFLFSYKACDAEQLGLSDDHHDRATELLISRRMFSRKPVVNSAGRTVPAITAIVFRGWERVGDWVEVPDPGRPGLRRAAYEVRVLFERERAGDIAVRGLSVFYALPVEMPDAEGKDQPAWQLAGWVDLTGPDCDEPR